MGSLFQYWCVPVITFIALFPFTGRTLRQAYFVELTDWLLLSKKVSQHLSRIVMFPGSSASNMRSSAKTITPTTSFLTLIPTFRCSALSISSSMMLNRSQRRQPCLTTALILIRLVNLPPTPITVAAPLYISITLFITSVGTPFLCKTF